LPSLPAPPASALVVPAPRVLANYRASSQTATVLHPALVRVRPRAKATVVGRLETRTPEGTSNLVPVVGRTKDRTGTLWVRVRLPVRSSDATGWVPRHALGDYRVLRTRLEIDLDRFTARLLDGGREVFRARVGIGKPASPTPRGSFYVRSKLTGYSSPFYGPLAFGTSARSSALTDWPAGGYVGIHGTSRPELLPGRVSHGCIRMRNVDILRLARLMPVGTPVTVR
jgi:L,D-transpeptidase catalytic domain